MFGHYNKSKKNTIKQKGNKISSFYQLYEHCQLLVIFLQIFLYVYIHTSICTYTYGDIHNYVDRKGLVGVQRLARIHTTEISLICLPITEPGNKHCKE